MYIHDKDIKRALASCQQTELFSIQCSHCDESFFRKKKNIVRAINKGNGRYKRMLRYKQGKSY